MLSLRNALVCLGCSLALLAIASVFASPMGAPQSLASCSFEEPISGSARRVVDLDSGSSGFQFTSRAEDTSNTLRGTFDLDSARMQLQLEQPGKPGTTRLAVEYTSVVEFRDVDGDGRLGLGDEIVREIHLANAAGATVHSVPRMQTDSYEVVARYPLNASSLIPGVAEIRFLVFSEPFTIGTEERSPDRMFIETAVDSFPFARNDTRLAFKVRQQGGVNLTASSDEIHNVGLAGTLSYRWSRCVDRDGVLVPVGPVVVEYPSGATPRTATVFAFPYGNRVEHATSLGLSSPPIADQGLGVVTLLPAGNWLVFGGTAIASVTLVVSTVWRRLRGA